MRTTYSRLILRIALSAGALLVLALATLVLSLQFWILPNLDHWRVQIAQSISASAGQPVQLGQLTASWQGWHPALRIQSLAVFSPQHQMLLDLSDVRAELSWSSLWLGELRLADLRLDHQTFSLHRTQDGTFWLAGIPLNRNTQRPGFADWLLRQQHIELRQATLSWQDDQRASPILNLREVSFDLYNRGKQHQFHLSATPPTLIAHPLSITGALNGRSTQQLANWDGRITVQMAGTDLAQWQPWLTLPLGIHQGFGNFDVQIQFARKQIIALTARILLEQSSMQFATNLPRLNLLALSGWVQWKRMGATQSLELKQVSLRNGDLIYLAPFDFYLRYTPANTHTAEQGSLRANNLSLNTMRRLAAYLPLLSTQQQWLDRYQPMGGLQQFNANWTGTPLHFNTFNLSGKFFKLGLNSVDNQPGFSGLSGQIDGNEHTGTLSLSSQHVTVDLPAILFEPHVALDSLTAQLGWGKEGAAYRFKLSQVNLINSDLNGQLFGNYLWQAGHPGVIDLRGGLLNGRGTAACHYLPLAVHQEVYDWVCQNVLGGISDRTQFHIQGDLAHYPFLNDKNGVLDVRIHVKDGIMRPDPEFPAIDHINGLLHFAGTRMTFQGDSARMYSAVLRHINVEIPDLYGRDKEKLLVDGEAGGKLSDFIRFANNSPVGKALDNLTAGATSQGTAKLGLHVQLPFRDIFHPLISGALTFNQDTITLANKWPELDAIRGTLAFTQNGISGQNISLQLFHRPALLSSASLPNGTTQITLRGQLAATELSSWLSPDLAGKFSGQTAWTGQIVLSHTRLADMVINSDLAGLAVNLPAPLGKPATSVIPLSFSTHTQVNGNGFISVRYGQIVSAQLITHPTINSGNTIERGNIQFGGAAHLPASPGISITGQLDTTQLDSWLGALSSLGGTGDQLKLPIQDLNLSIAHLYLFDRNFNSVNLHAHHTNGLWNATAQGSAMQGNLSWIPPGAANPQGLLSAHFKMLNIPTGNAQLVLHTTTTAPPSPAHTESNWPALTFLVDALQLDNRNLGQLDIHAVPITNGLNFDHITLTHPDSTLNLAASWHPDALPQTQAHVQLTLHNIGDFFSRFGQPNIIKRGQAVINGDASWNGNPIDIPISSLSGQLTLQAEKGQFLKADPGAAKLLGILSLQDLLHHLSLDFRDVFNDGFAFSDISATFQLNHGIIYSKDFVMDGPAASVQIQGNIDIGAQTQELHAVVSPKLSESVALASSLVGGPVVGVSMLALQTLLGNPLGHAASFDYTITGPWNKPLVVRSWR